MLRKTKKKDNGVTRGENGISKSIVLFVGKLIFFLRLGFVFRLKRWAFQILRVDFFTCSSELVYIGSRRLFPPVGGTTSPYKRPYKSTIFAPENRCVGIIYIFLGSTLDCYYTKRRWTLKLHSSTTTTVYTLQQKIDQFTRFFINSGSSLSITINVYYILETRRYGTKRSY